MTKVAGLWAAAGLAMAVGAGQAQVVRIDASAPVPPPLALKMTLGWAKAPDGRVIGANSQYLTMDGKPWLPVMGEFHFSRYPAAEWEEELLKMKAAGVQVVASYIIWLHHEQHEGVWNWTGQRDLRRFAELCRKHGMYFYPRIGPWAHAETRNGGIPDWAMQKGPVRQNDPVYLAEVDAFYRQIAQQLRGEWWKDGGPVIGLQIENEYRARGQGKGVEHLRKLKEMAVAAGMDVPLYTVTGWDGAAIPLDAALPVYGGYPDAPWDGKAEKLPPNEVYAFRFANRNAGNMGAMGGGQQSPSSAYAGTPFLTAEVGDGIEDTYFRRPVVAADDVAALPTVMLGSGANLLGYYMFHGGRNPDGGEITLQESQRTGYPTDVPVRSYDFQAPLGEFGQVRESLRKLKLVHYFLLDFGAELAPMAVHAPADLPGAPGDLTVARVAARTRGEAGFVFFNNHVRGVEMPVRKGFQVELKLESGAEVRVPEKPIDLPSDAYGIWPVNLQLAAGLTLRYSTAQLFKRVVRGGETYFFFAGLKGIAPEFAVAQHGAMTVRRVDAAAGGAVKLPGGVHLVVLPQERAERVWRTDDPALLVESDADVFSDGTAWTLSSYAPEMRLGVFGSAAAPGGGGLKVVAAAQAGVFAEWKVAVPALRLQASVTQVKTAGASKPWEYGPELSWRKTRVPMAPDDADFAGAAEWRVEVPAIPAKSAVADLFLEVRYSGDVARLYAGNELVDDDFWNGVPWTVGLRETGAAWKLRPSEFRLEVLPLPKSYPMYIEQASQLVFARDRTTPAAPEVRLIPQYRVELQAPAH